jgi:integrase
MNSSADNTAVHSTEHRVSVTSEASSGKPSLEDFQKVARRRFQDPKPRIEGDWWYIRPWRDETIAGRVIRKRVRIKIAEASVGYREARKLATEHLGRINQEASAGSIATLKEYVQREYIPTDLLGLAKPVQDCYAGVIARHIEPDLGGKCFRELTSVTLRRYFADLARKGVPHPTIVKVRDALSSVLRFAVENEYLVKNPLAGVKLPKDKRARRRKPTITPEQFAWLVEVMPEPYATAVFVAAWTGLRVSELFALRWRCINSDSISIEERFCRGDFSEPKTEASAATIGVELFVIERINALKSLSVSVRAGRAKRTYKLVKSHQPDDLVFQSVRDGKPLRDGNVLRRFIKPAAKALGVDGVNWQCLRRSHATWLVRSGADPKSVQGQMRHSRISTTMDVYAQIVNEGQQQALRSLANYAKRAVPILSQLSQ